MTAAGRFADLRTRVVSGLVLGIGGIGLLALGGAWTALFLAAIGGAMAWEWRAITCHGGAGPGWDAAPLVLALTGAVLIAHLLTPPLAFLWLGALAILGAFRDGLGLAASGMTAKPRPAERPAPLPPVGRGWGWGWGVLGAAYLGTALIAFGWLRDHDPFGFWATVWVLSVVVAADIGGYFAGRLIGGPKLWPAVSPKKTWAGLAGGVGLAFLAGGLFSWATVGTYYQQVCAVSAIAAILAQAGDLGESALKRRFGVKDSGRLIPGHGGVLDRMDGMLAASLVAAGVTWARGQTVFIW